VAYELLNQRTVPSWGFQIDAGATTMWERWDGYVPGRGYQEPTSNSFNHFAFGAVGEWIVRAVAGINPEEDPPAYKQFTLRPRPGGDLTYARAEYDSVRGKIVSGWSLEGKTLNLEVTVPANTTATIYVPAQDPTRITEGGRPASEAEGVTFLGIDEGAAVFALASGHYQFVVAPPD
jgi:hypothetical protein